MKTNNEKRENKINGGNTMYHKQKMKKNMQRLGGRGLSLEAFANAKTLNNNYNPAIIKKQREFYKNAKCVNKYKKSLKQQQHDNNPSTSSYYRPKQQDQDKDETEKIDNSNSKSKKSRKESGHSLKEVYEKKRNEEDKARMEREAIFQTKKEERLKSEARRKDLREKMFKKTRSGQPVMKYRIEHLLETIQNSKD